MNSILNVCILAVFQSFTVIHAENPILTALKNNEKGHFGLIGFRDQVQKEGDYIENVLGDKVKFNESIHSWNNISYKYLTECDVKYPLNKFMFTTTNRYMKNTYRKRFFQQDSRENMFTKKYEAKYARLRASSTVRTTRFSKATNMFDSKLMMDDLLENYPDIGEHTVSLMTWPRKLWTGTYPTDKPKIPANMTTPEDWSLNIQKTYSEEDYVGPDRRLDPKDSMSAYGLSLAKEKVHYPDEYNSQILPELERQWKIRGDKKNIEAGLDRPSADIDDPRMFRPAATHYFMGCKIDLNHYRPFETMNQSINPYLPYNEFYKRPGFDPVAWYRTVRDLHWEINPDSELSDVELRKKFTLIDSEDYGDQITTTKSPGEEEYDESERKGSESDDVCDEFKSVNYYNSDIYPDSILTTAELAEKNRRRSAKVNRTKRTTSRLYRRKFSMRKTETPPTTMCSEEIARILNAEYEELKTIPPSTKRYHPDDSGPIHPMFKQKELLHKLYPGVTEFQLQELNELDQYYVREKDILNCSSFTISMKNLRNIELRHNLKISELPPVPMMYWVHPNKSTGFIEDTTEVTYPRTDFIVTESIETYMNMTPFNIHNIKKIEKKFNIYLNDSTLRTELPDSIIRLNDFLTVRADLSNDYHDLINYGYPVKRKRRDILSDLTSLFDLQQRRKKYSENRYLTKSRKIISKRKKRSAENDKSAESNLKRWKNHQHLNKISDVTPNIQQDQNTVTPEDFYYSEDDSRRSKEVKKDAENKEAGAFMKGIDMNNIKNMNTEELKKIRDYQLEHSAEIEKYLLENKEFINQHKDTILDADHRKLAKEIHQKIGKHPTKYVKKATHTTTQDPKVIERKKEKERKEKEMNEQIYKLSNIRNRLAPMPGDIVDYYHLKFGWRITEPPTLTSEELRGNKNKKKNDGKIDPFEPYFKLPSVEKIYVYPETTTILPLDFGRMNKSQVEANILKYGIGHVLKLSRQKTTMSYKEFKRKRMLEGKQRVKGEIRPRQKSNKERINALFDENWKLKDNRLKRRRKEKQAKKEKMHVMKIPFYLKERAKDQRCRKRIFDKKVVFKVDNLDGDIVTQRVTIKKPVGPIHYHAKKKGEMKLIDGNEIFKIKLMKETTTIRTKAPYNPEHESDYSEEDRPVNKGVEFETSEEALSKNRKLSKKENSKESEIEKNKKSEQKSKNPIQNEEKKQVDEEYDSFDYQENKGRKDPNLDEIEQIKHLKFHSCGSIKETEEIERRAKKLMKGFRKRKHKMLLRKKYAKHYNLTHKSLEESEESNSQETQSNDKEDYQYEIPARKFRYIKEYDGSKIRYEKEYLDSDNNKLDDEYEESEKDEQNASKEPNTNVRVNNKEDLLIPEIRSQKSEDETNEHTNESKYKTLKRHKRFLRLSTPPRHTTKGFNYIVRNPIYVDVTHLTNIYSYEDDLLYSIGTFNITTTSTQATSTIQLLPPDYLDINKYVRRNQEEEEDTKRHKREVGFTLKYPKSHTLDWWAASTRTVFTTPQRVSFEDILYEPIIKCTFNYKYPRRNFTEFFDDAGERVRRSVGNPNSNRGYIGNFKISVDILMKSIMKNKRAARQERSVTGATLPTVTDYNGKVEDPHSNCCNNDESREDFRAGVRQVKMKKFKNHFDAIKPPTPKNPNATKRNIPHTTCLNMRTIELRKRRDLDELYPSNMESGASHELGKYGIRDEEHTITVMKRTRWPTTPKIMNIPRHPTKTKQIEDVENRYSVKIENLTTPFTFKWSPYGLIITNSEDLDSDSELEVMDWYAERESPTYTTKLTPTHAYQTEPTLYDYDGITNFNPENIKNIERKYNVSLKDMENNPNNIPIIAKTLGFGLVDFRDRIKNMSSHEAIIDKFEPDFTPQFPTDPGFRGPNGEQIEYGLRDWVLKDILEKWRIQENGSFETLHRRAENFTLEEMKKECVRLGIPWTKPVKLVTSPRSIQAREHVGVTNYTRDEQVMENHYKHVEEVCAYHKEHDLIPKKGTEETHSPESEERQKTIMDWICRGWTQSQEHAHPVTNSPPRVRKRDISTEGSRLIVGDDCYQTFDDPREFADAMKNLQNESNAIEVKGMNEEGDRNNTNSLTSILPKRMKREMPYMGFSGLTTRVIFEWTNFPYEKTKAPFFVRKDKIRLKHRPTNAEGIPIFIRRKQWTFHTTPEYAGQSLKWIHGIPQRESLDYGMTVSRQTTTTTEQPFNRDKREVHQEMTDIEDYTHEQDTEINGSSKISVNNADQYAKTGELNETEASDETHNPRTINGNAATVTTRMYYTKPVNRNEISKRIKRQLWTGFEVIRQRTPTKSQLIKNVEKRFSIDIAKITTIEPLNMTLLLEIMSRIVFTYADTEAPTTTEPPPSSVVKFRTVYHRQKRDQHDRFMEYVDDPMVRTVYAPHLVSPSTKYPEKRPTLSTRWGDETSWYQETLRRKKRLFTQERVMPYIRADAFIERATGHNFSYYVSHEPLISVIDRFKRSVDDKVKSQRLKAQNSIGQTESWLKRNRREMPYMGFSGLTTRVIFEWTNFPYEKTKAPFFVRKDKIRLKHRPTNAEGIPIFIRRKQWTFHTTPEYAGQSLKWIHGIPQRESLDYGMTVSRQTTTTTEQPFNRDKREVRQEMTDIEDYNEPNPAFGRGKRDVGNTTAASTSSRVTCSTTAAVSDSPAVENKTSVSGTSRFIDNLSVNGTSTTSKVTEPLTDTDFQTPLSNVINPVQTLGRKKRALPQPRRKGKDLFERIIQVYFNCKNVWKEPHSPEILQIRRRYREQKNRPIDRIFGRRHHNHVDIYYDEN